MTTTEVQAQQRRRRGAIAILQASAPPLALTRSDWMRSLLIFVAAVLTLLLRFPNFGGNGFSTVGGDQPAPPPPPDAWLLDAFPLRGMTTLVTQAGRAATGLPTYLGEVISRDVHVAAVPITSFAILAAILFALGFRRFSRMDIIE